MKHIILFFLTSILYSLTFTACDTDKTELMSVTGNDELQLHAGITGLTRANDAGFETGDSLGVYAVKWKSDSEQDSLRNHNNYADNVCFRLENPSDQSWIPAQTVYYPNDDCKIDLYAYYPYRTSAFGSGTTISLSVAANQSVGNRYTRSDFMVACTDNVSRTPSKVPLVFSHKLSQMVFELLPGAGFTPDDLLGAKVKIINAITNATYDLSEGSDAKPVAGSTRSDIVPAGSWVKDGNKLTGVMAIVVPQEINSDTYFEITLGKRKFTFKPEPVTMNSGCSHKITMTVNNTKVQITTEINPWNNCIPVNGEANEEFDNTELLFYAPLKEDTEDHISGNTISGGTFEDGGYKCYGSKAYNIDTIRIGKNNPLSVSLYAKSLDVAYAYVILMGFNEGEYAIAYNQQTNTFGCPAGTFSMKDYNVKEWNHYCWTIDEDCVARFYINKKLVAEKQNDFSSVVYTKVVLFGSPKYSDGNGTSILKEVKVFKGVLSQEQINKL